MEVETTTPFLNGPAKRNHITSRFGFCSILAIIAAVASVCFFAALVINKVNISKLLTSSGPIAQLVTNNKVSNTSTAFTWPKVVLLGDSLTEWSLMNDSAWGAIVGDRLSRTSDLVIRGFGGYTSGSVRLLMPKLYPTFGEPIAAVVVLLGMMDAVLLYERQTMEVYKGHLKGIIDFLEVSSVII